MPGRAENGAGEGGYARSVSPILFAPGFQVRAQPSLRHTLLLATLALPLGCATEGMSAEPRCPRPAPLQGKAVRGAATYIVVFRNGTDARAATERLAARYHFAAKHVYTSALLGFAAELKPEALAGVRCDRAVRYVERDAPVSTF